MDIRNQVVFVTGANRGLGRCLVDALLAAGASKVYAASRRGNVDHADPRVVAVTLDITDAAQAKAAAALAADARIVVNNAGVLTGMSVLAHEGIWHDIDVNVRGMLNVVRAFAPNLIAAKQGAFVNVLSIAAWASMPMLGGYAASKAAAYSITQALRGELRPHGVTVFAAFPGTIDTDMVRHFDTPKASPVDVADGILAGVIAGDEDIAPCAMSKALIEQFKADPVGLQKQMAAMG